MADNDETMSDRQPSVSMPDAPMQRVSVSSGRSGGSRSRQTPQQQLSTIEKSVTHLLVATKQLLETLTMWSNNRATEGEVSDVYVRLGYEFNMACRAFGAIGVETQDLGPVPDILRTILEQTLSQEASQQSLEKYLPRIRDIIINLLHGLKKKQQRLRQRSGKEGEPSKPPRQSSTASNMSVDSSITQQLADVPSRTTSSRSFMPRLDTGELGGPDVPPRTTSTADGRSSPTRAGLSPQNSLSVPTLNMDLQTSDSTSSISSNALQNIPVIAPYPEGETMPMSQGYDQDRLSPDPSQLSSRPNDALTALQKGGDLERRASRRFSAYHIQKSLGTSMTGIPALPPPQHSPVPNRGRDVRESMSAVRSRGSLLHSRARSRNNREGFEASPNRANEVRRISEEASSQAEDNKSVSAPTASQDQSDSPTQKTPEDKLGSYPFPDTPAEQRFSATLNGPLDEPYADTAYTSPTQKEPPAAFSATSIGQVQDSTHPVAGHVSESAPQAGKELTLFLQYKSKIKKFVLPDDGDLSMARLQLAFIEKFAWNTQNMGVDLPEIYVQDPVSGVRHELEDLNDVKDRSVLVLNVEALDEVKRHFDDGIGGLRKLVEGIRISVDDQQSALQRVSDRQQETAKELAGLAVAPPSTSVVTTSSATAAPNSIAPGHLKELQTLRRDLAVVRQTYTSFVADVTASMAAVRSKAVNVKKAANRASITEMDSNSGRTYVNKGKKSLSDDSENIVNRVDDLQDLVEDLRKDVVTRGVRPLPRQLETVSKDISVATADLKKLQEFLKYEKPIWTKIWEKELQVVCDDRDLLTMQEELAADLEDDLEKAAATFALVEEATKQQNLQNTSSNTQSVRSTSRTLKPLTMDQGADPHKAKDNVLGEVRALQPNHESRLEAIERAERARQRELENRDGGEFQQELGNFVGEGKLKKSGGVEEVERMRKIREDQTRKEVYERQQQRAREMAEREAAEAAAKANGEATTDGEGGAANDASVLANGVQGLDAQAAAHGNSTERESSPEPDFVEAKEEVGSPLNENMP